MPTKVLQHAQTRSIAIAAPPATVLAYVSNPQNLPRWAPSFAPSIIERDRQLIVRRADDSEFAICVQAGAKEGTVDIVSAIDHRRGAFTRVLPNNDGSEFVFTLLFDRSTPETAIADQMAIIDEELAAVRDACEACS